MEVSQVRKRVQQGVATARTRAQERRQQADEATRDYKVFLEVVATPLVQQLANVLKVEGYAFTASTPGDSVRLTNDRGRATSLNSRSIPAANVHRSSAASPSRAAHGDSTKSSRSKLAHYRPS
jgi:hypothetical protein